MTGTASDDEASDDEAALTRYAGDLAQAVAVCVPLWIERSVRERADADAVVTESVSSALATAQLAVMDSEVARIRELLATDIDAQRIAPLAVLRQAVRHPTEVLRMAGAPEPRRDRFSLSQFPDDVYDLTPASWADVHPDLHEPGMAWGAAKAFVHLARRRAEGKQ